MTANTKSWFTDYFSGYTYDEMFTESLDVKPVWKPLFDHFQKMGKDGMNIRQGEMDWLLAENGVTYNVYNDPNGLNRPWSLNVIPYLLQETEWDYVQKGLQQRAHLLDLVLKDIYGPRNLIKNGILPFEIIYGHRGFLRQCDQIKYNTQRQLHLHAADLARGTDGRLWVVNDRTQAPSGMGYALENRATSKRVLSSMFNDLQIQPLAGFFQAFSDLLISAAPNGKPNPSIVVLTPGSHNETYFEHAYLASFLGYPLVQGHDLVVRDGYVWMKSLKGLKKIDVILRRVDDVYADPLELREDSQLGVAGLLDVVRQQHVSILNPIGSGVLENPGLIPFMPAVAKYFLNEDLILPQIASWWCGQEKEKNYVLQNLNQLVIKRIDRTNRESIHFGEYLTTGQLEAISQEIKAQPYRFVAQEKISFSTTPNFQDNHFEPRNMVARAFSIATPYEYKVMPGGLVRVAPERGKLRVSNRRGGTSKDFWILGNSFHGSPPDNIYDRSTKTVASGLDDLPSLTAENLFWAGRYVGRLLNNARFLRMVLKQMTSARYDNKESCSVKLRVLFKAVTQLTGTYPGFCKPPKTGPDPMDAPLLEMISVILDRDRVGSLSQTMQMFSNAYYSIRNLWSNDMWRVFESILKSWRSLENETIFSEEKLIKALNQLITRLIAFMGLIEESILVQQGLLLYFIGLQLEQASLTITKCRSLLALKSGNQLEHEILEALLLSHESHNIYRYSYKSHIQIESVLQLLLKTENYPRALSYHLKRLGKDISRLPKSRSNENLTSYQKYFFEAYAKLKLADIDNLLEVDPKSPYVRQNLDELFDVLSDLLFEASQELGKTYFDHSDAQDQLVKPNFPLS
ncbi:MAG: circularly permuted type 2 ATP-grasp protein [Leeuwenhoekiella sp.]